MKKTTFAAMAAAVALVLLSFSFTKNTEQLNLTAPTGQRIAANVHALKMESASLIATRHGSVAFEIIDVSYLPVKQGYAAIVTYKLADGTIDKYGIFSGVELKIAQGMNAVARDGKVKISCVGSCTCRMSTTINTDTGVITVDCGCTNCPAEITQS